MNRDRVFWHTPQPTRAWLGKNGDLEHAQESRRVVRKGYFMQMRVFGRRNLGNQ